MTHQDEGMPKFGETYWYYDKDTGKMIYMTLAEWILFQAIIKDENPNTSNNQSTNPNITSETGEATRKHIIDELDNWKNLLG